MPDIVFLNLSVEEFPNRENDLPEGLVKLIENPTVRLNWVDGPNKKTMKKVFPILPFLDDDDIIIYMDDDILVQPGFVRSRVDDFLRNECKHPISGGKSSGRTYGICTEMTGVLFNSSS